MAVHALIATCDRHELGAPDYPLDELRGDWAHPGFALDRDAWVVETPEGTLVGYAHLLHREHVRMRGMAMTHPDYYRQGIGSALLALMEARSREHIPLAPPDARVCLQLGVIGVDTPPAQLLRDHGYQHVRTFSQMRIALDRPIPAPVWAEGITPRPFVEGRDERAVWEAKEAAFADHWGFMPEPFEDWMARHEGVGRPQAGLQRIAVDGETVAGVALCRIVDGLGWVDTLGVRREYRRRGIGMALLWAAFRDFARRGLTEAGLGVDATSLTGANRLYEQAGMHVHVRYGTFEKELRPGVELSVRRIGE